MSMVQEKMYMDVDDVCAILGVSKTYAYCNAIFSSGADTEEFFYRLGLKDGRNLKSTVKFILEMLSGNVGGGELKDEE